MARITPSAPRGMRDFGPEESFRRNYIFDTIRQVYQQYGYEPIETPAMENLETLTGKYGEEGDRLIFKVLNSGDYFSDLQKTDIGLDSRKALKHISSKALRYDLTVPFARYVVQYQHKITMPFKRYQIQPVWRADNPQKGRYREFYQCDADVIGSGSLLYEMEFVQIFNEVLNQLKINGFAIKINNRKILSGIAESTGVGDLIIPFTIALDKLDKIGEEKVLEEMLKVGISEGAVEKIRPLLHVQGNNAELLDFLNGFLSGSETGLQGVKELRQVIETSEKLGISNGKVEVDLTLARGLDYYTGCIFEVKVPDSGFGSIAGGGRYDNLTGIFGLDGLSGCGISFGADRIYDLLLQENLFPAYTGNRTDFLFLNFGDAEALFSFEILQTLRKKGFLGAVYPDAAKIKKQFSYADKIQARYVVIVGTDEMQAGKISIKNMADGQQETLSVADFTENLSQYRFHA